MHRSLESIVDETTFREILLRLLQGGLPLYAQVRHGPIEYGKDISALLEVNEELILRHYQVKCGEINATKWRESKYELEQIFLVPLNHFQLPAPPSRIEGLLISNGHANPYQEPLMMAWFDEQRRVYGRDLKFMHLDALVDWIVGSRLTNELRAAFEEHGINL
jgi:hypothetical protein